MRKIKFSFTIRNSNWISSNFGRGSEKGQSQGFTINFILTRTGKYMCIFFPMNCRIEWTRPSSPTKLTSNASRHIQWSSPSMRISVKRNVYFGKGPTDIPEWIPITITLVSPQREMERKTIDGSRGPKEKAIARQEDSDPLSLYSCCLTQFCLSGLSILCTREEKCFLQETSFPLYCWEQIYYNLTPSPNLSRKERKPCSVKLHSVPKIYGPVFHVSFLVIGSDYRCALLRTE